MVTLESSRRCRRRLDCSLDSLANPDLRALSKLPQPVGIDHDSVFHQDWWAEAACPGQWSKITCHRDNLKVAEFTYSVRKRFGFTEIGHPFLARTMEPRIWLPPAKSITQLTNLVSIITEIRDQLPPHDLFWYNLPPGNLLELPYELAGYTIESSYTFRSLPDEQQAWDGMDAKTRNRIRTAQRLMHIEEHADIERFISLSKRFVSARSWRNGMDTETIRRVFEACNSRGLAQIVTAVNEKGEDLAAAILLGDDRHVYFWMSARDPSTSLGSAVSLVIWHAIQWSISRNLVFDMDGYASPAAGVFYAKFGLVPARRTHVRWASDSQKWMTHVTKMTRQLLKRR